MKGRYFGYLLVTGYSHTGDDGALHWKTVCVCGKTKTVIGRNLRRGASRSCGCRQGNWIHGGTKNTMYNTWKSMKKRCFSRLHPSYINYGARGITVCDRWLYFPDFYEDMGDCPAGLSLDRIDNDGNYEPDNCKWSTPKEQANNRRPYKKEKA